MRIALFTETYLPYINGVVTHVKLLREGLEKLGHTVLVVKMCIRDRMYSVSLEVLSSTLVSSAAIYSRG